VTRFAAGTPATNAEATDPGAIRVCVRELTQIFNAIDPSPFAERDLNDEAERFIVSWARDLPADAPLALTVEVSRAAPLHDPGPPVQEAVHVFFARRAETTSRELRALLRRGRTSLVIGLLFLTACVVASDLATNRVHDAHLAGVLREGLTVAGWVAMWRPMEIFLYSWWPLVGDRRLYQRLSRMPVQVRTPRGDAGDDGGAGGERASAATSAPFIIIAPARSGGTPPS
jgi:hypothetical protein